MKLIPSFQLKLTSMYRNRYGPQSYCPIEKLQPGLVTILAHDGRSYFPCTHGVKEVPNDQDEYRYRQNVKYRKFCQLAFPCLK